jgi:hypothetical protein
MDRKKFQKSISRTPQEINFICFSINILIRKKQRKLRSFITFGYSGSATNKTYLHNIAEILLKVALSTINQTYQLGKEIAQTYAHISAF